MGKITIVGLGPGGLDGMTLGSYRLIKDKQFIYARTVRHPAVEELMAEGVAVEGLDRYYEEADSFEEVYSNISAYLLEKASQQDLLYAVPGHPLVAERTVDILLEKAPGAGVEVEIPPAMSFLDALYAVLHIDPLNGLMVVDGMRLEEALAGLAGLPAGGLVVTQFYDGRVASDVKLALMELLPDEYEVVMARAAGIPGEEKTETMPLYMIDRVPWIDHLTSLFVPPLQDPEYRLSTIDDEDECFYPLDPLVDIMARLRGDEGCPWDREQTHLTLKKYLLEETYEVLEALDNGKMNKICEELGDLLLQIAFHAQIASEEGHFDMNDVVEVICEKLVRRHPHIFGETVVSGSEEVSRNWARIKEQEKAAQEGNAPSEGEAPPGSYLDGIPATMPALMRAQKVQARAARIGFDWPDYSGAWEKVQEEAAEVRQAIDALHNGGGKGIGDTAETGVILREKLAGELGDLLFAVVNLSRFFGIEAEEALMITTAKFYKRFSYIEQEARKQDRKLEDMTLQEMDNFWEASKKA